MNEEFPENWKSFDLKDICFFQEGPGLRNWQYREKGTKFINIRCIKDGYLDTSISQFISSDEVESKYNHFLLNEGDYVLSSSGTIGRIAVVHKYDLPLLLNTSVIRFRTLDESKLDTKYLFYFLQSKQFYEKIFEQSQGSAQVNFGPSHLKLLNVSLPPLPVQRKIAEILSVIDRQLILLIKQKNKLIKLKFGLFRELIINNKNAKFRKISDICLSASGGTPNRSNLNYYKGNVPWVKSGEVKGLDILQTEEQITNEAIKNSSAKIIKSGSVLIAMYGATAGQSALLKVNAATNQAVLALTVDSKCLDNIYLYHALSALKKDLLLSCQGSGQPNLSSTLINNFSIPVPELFIQNQINKILNSLLINIDNLNLKIKRITELKKSISSDLLSGRQRINV